MAPILATVLIGVAVKLGLGLAASAAKKVLEGASPTVETKRPESFESLLKARAAEASGQPAVTLLPGTSGAAAPLPSDLAGRLASEERARSLVLDVYLRHNLPVPAMMNRYAREAAPPLRVSSLQ